jgi:hypothetical protein
MKNVVDNVATQCWEDLLIKPLPDILTPTTIIEMEAVEIDKIAKEPTINTDQRDSLTRTIQILESGLETCRKHVNFRFSSKWHTAYHHSIAYVPLPTKAGKGHGYTEELEKTQEEASFEPKDVGDPISNHGTKNFFQNQPPILVEPTAERLLPPPAIGEPAADETLPPAVDKNPVIGNGSEFQTVQMLDAPQALPKKKKKAKGVE